MGLKVTLLAGGTGGTKLAHGFALIGPEVDLTVIANVGDDAEVHGLHVSPDLDTLLYTLSGLVDAERGWGIRDDTLSAHAMFARLGEETWFTVGDADLATHAHRTRLLREGVSLTDATAAMAAALGVTTTLLPATDDRLRTRLETDAGLLDFQDYFVRLRQEPAVTGHPPRRHCRRAPDRCGAGCHRRCGAARHRSVQSLRQHRSHPRAGGRSRGRSQRPPRRRWRSARSWPAER